MRGGVRQAGRAERRGRAEAGWYRSPTALLLGAAGLAGGAGFLLSASRIVAAVICWRLAFFAALAALLLNLPLLRGAWRGRLHLWPALRRPVPFEAGEFARGARLAPLQRPFDVSGRAALVGVGFLMASGLVWLGGLAFAPVGATGTAEIRAGESTSDSRPSGSRPDGLEYAFALPQEHRFVGVVPEGGALVQAADPASQQTGQYEARFGRPILLAGHRIQLETLYEQSPPQGLRVAVEAAGESAEATLRAGQPVTVGQVTLELAGIDPDFEDTGFEAFRVAIDGPPEPRSVWLIPAAPEIDEHAAGPVRLRPLEVLRTETAVLRFTERWVWGWRVAVLALAGCGAFLMLLVPHRSWVWIGEPGDWTLLAWSLNGHGSVRTWSDEALGEALGQERFAELLAIERELAAPADEDGPWT